MRMGGDEIEVAMEPCASPGCFSNPSMSQPSSLDFYTDPTSPFSGNNTDTSNVGPTLSSPLSGFVLDPAKCSRLSLGEKREIVHEIAQWSKEAPEILQSWSRRELLEIICAEMGKERKYTGFTKFRMIDHLLKLVSKKSKKKKKKNERNPLKSPKGPTRQKKKEQPPHIPSNLNHIRGENDEVIQCENLACRAVLSPDDHFCKRCSCCICYQYDDNKDPSLWLTCNSDPPYEADPCGFSCHLTCALKHERSGILKNGCGGKLDGSFYCVSCGKINELMSTCKKQLLIAKEARRVDVLCLRISLSHTILNGTERYKELQKTVSTAAKILKKEVGPLDRVSSKMARGIVNRLSCAAEVQNLCSSAVEAFDSIISEMSVDHMDQKEPPTCKIRFEETSATTVIIVLEYEEHYLEEFLGCRLWHRDSSTKDYPLEPTCIVLRPEKKFKLTQLEPSTEYLCKVSLFSSEKILGVWEAKWVTPPSIQTLSRIDSTNSSNNPTKLRSLEEINKNKTKKAHIPLVGPPSIPITPSKSEKPHEAVGFGCKKEVGESDYEYSVRVIRRLECDGHIDTDFRVKFLTWFSLKATMQERRVVSAFVNTLMDDLASLAGQLLDSFSDEICGEQRQDDLRGFCTKLWH